MYTILTPVFKRVMGMDNISLCDLRAKTMKYIKTEEMFNLVDVHDVIIKHSVYFIEDF